MTDPLSDLEAKARAAVHKPLNRHLPEDDQIEAILLSVQALREFTSSANPSTVLKLVEIAKAAQSVAALRIGPYMMGALEDEQERFARLKVALAALSDGG
jgi:hypothetical protein